MYLGAGMAVGTVERFGVEGPLTISPSDPTPRPVEHVIEDDIQMGTVIGERSPVQA